MGRLYVILALCLGIFGCMANRLTSVPAPATASADGSERDLGIDADSGSSRYASSTGDSAPAGTALILERRSDGHFYAPVDINGTEIEMLIDTGASGVALSADAAKRAGIARSIGMNDAIGEGAGGTVYGDFVSIDRVRLGEVEADHVPAVILDGGSMSLLGQSFLRRFGSVRITGDHMVLE